MLKIITLAHNASAAVFFVKLSRSIELIDQQWRDFEQVMDGLLPAARNRAPSCLIMSSRIYEAKSCYDSLLLKFIIPKIHHQGRARLNGGIQTGSLG